MDAVQNNVESESSTLKLFTALDGCYKYFNKALFNNELNNRVIINCSRKSRAYGFFATNSWGDSEGSLDEISINPDTMSGRKVEEILSTLVHEMVHLWQHKRGEAPARPYHNKAWAKKMESVGLMPSHNGKPGGKKVGVNMTHYIVEGGKFEQALQNLPEEHKLPFVGLGGHRRQSKTRGYNKYVCATCGAVARAKPGASFACAPCSRKLMMLVELEDRGL